MSLERLDKMLAQQGVLSRSEIKKAITRGRVTVNGIVEKSYNRKIDTDKDLVTLDGNEVLFEKYVYLMMNKPAGVVCATEDKREKTVIDIIPQEYKRKGLFPVGRLDKDTEGLLIITNDGDFAHKVTSPNKNVYKTYTAIIDSPINDDDIKAFENGIVFKDGTSCKKAYLKAVNLSEPYTVQVKISEGMFHQVKKMLLVRGKQVLYLKREGIGNLCLDGELANGDVKKMSILDINNIFVDEMH
ncbi:MAG: pseudouridine synthase [Acutalibacteraceae bacterium]|nr:pseudouridine synthase [Acutalibacteraceae bacterium]